MCTYTHIHENTHTYASAHHLLTKKKKKQQDVVWSYCLLFFPAIVYLMKATTSTTRHGGQREDHQCCLHSIQQWPDPHQDNRRRPTLCSLTTVSNPAVHCPWVITRSPNDFWGRRIFNKNGQRKFKRNMMKGKILRKSTSSSRAASFLPALH